MGFNNALYGEGTGVTYLGGACSNVSCHGGSDHTVSWLSGTSLGGTDRATCEKCHNQIDLAGSPTQYIDVINGDADPLNSFGNTGWFDSGMNLHALHLSQTTATECITCHDPAKLAARHFINILSGKKSINPGDARDTLIGPSDAPSANPNYGVTSYIYTGGTPKSSCLAASGCHNGNLARTWFQ
jgi:hypothetical protein